MSLTASEVNELILRALNEDDEDVDAIEDVRDIPWSEVGEFFASEVEVGGYFIETVMDEREDGSPSNWKIVLCVRARQQEFQFFSFAGYYDSWNGCEWGDVDGVEEVFEHTETVVRYY
jgi:hypothetical protein